MPHLSEPKLRVALAELRLRSADFFARRESYFIAREK
jgi:hypothetical protein